MIDISNTDYIRIWCVAIFAVVLGGPPLIIEIEGDALNVLDVLEAVAYVALRGLERSAPTLDVE